MTLIKKLQEIKEKVQNYNTSGENVEYTHDTAAYLCYNLKNENLVRLLCNNLKNGNGNYDNTFTYCECSIPDNFFKTINKIITYPDSTTFYPFGTDYNYYNFNSTFKYYNNETLSLNIENYPVLGRYTFYMCKSNKLITNNNEIWLGYADNTFAYSGFEELPVIDLTGCCCINYMFQSCQKLKKIEFKGRMFCDGATNETYINFGSSSKPMFSNMFNSCTKLESIKGLDLTYVPTGGTNTFWNCKSLIELDFTGTENLQINLDLSPTALDTEGLMNMLNTLPTLDHSQTITIGKTKMALLTEEQIVEFTLKGYTLA